MLRRLKQIKGGHGTGRPIIDNSDIVFNGDASKGEEHESFQLSKCDSGFQFCKTARKPYDRYVKAVLIVANMVAPGALDITCDGDNEPDCWTEGVSIANQYLKIPGRSACSPLEAKQVAKTITHCPDCANERGVAIPASCPHGFPIGEVAVVMTSVGTGKSMFDKPSHSDPYKGVYKELDRAVEKIEKLAEFMDDKSIAFLANYLKANIDDIKDTYEGT
jgi:hypothetical protein